MLHPYAFPLRVQSNLFVTVPLFSFSYHQELFHRRCGLRAGVIFQLGGHHCRQCCICSFLAVSVAATLALGGSPFFVVVLGLVFGVVFRVKFCFLQRSQLPSQRLHFMRWRRGRQITSQLFRLLLSGRGLCFCRCGLRSRGPQLSFPRAALVQRGLPQLGYFLAKLSNF